MWQTKIRNISLIIDFNEDVAVAAVDQPIGRSITSTKDGGFITKVLILAEKKRIR
jgi:hypothetical protein